MGGLPVAMTEYHNVGHGKRMSHKILRMVVIKAAVDVFQRVDVGERRGIDQIVVALVHGQHGHFQPVERFKTVWARFFAAFDLIDGKSVVQFLVIVYTPHEIVGTGADGCGGVLVLADVN
ncbi:hypothetical protein SDC9_177879 [bioreactor metagenome]|uniref:Uncharacterized protein n=1 Tax=bioreactor metagenome TaxID=1076179 RepID=A0A645GU88_9ZZZZ